MICIHVFPCVQPKYSLHSNGVLVLNPPGLCVSQEELHETSSGFAAPDDFPSNFNGLAHFGKPLMVPTNVKGMNVVPLCDHWTWIELDRFIFAMWLDFIKMFVKHVPIKWISVLRRTICFREIGAQNGETMPYSFAWAFHMVTILGPAFPPDQTNLGVS